MTVTAMTVDRRLITVDKSLLLEACPWYVQASAGVYVPRCDLRQYEAGERPAIE